MDIQKKIDEFVNDAFKGKVAFNILLVSDETSRLSVLRGHNALSYFRKHFAKLADVNLVSMTSSDFCRINPDLTKYNVLWIDNVINERMNLLLVDKLDDLASSLVGKNVLELPEADQILARKLRSPSGGRCDVHRGFRPDSECRAAVRLGRYALGGTRQGRYQHSDFRE